MREGEVTILGGLSQNSDSKSVSGIPGLVDIPALGSVLFGSQNTDKEIGELMIAVIPHIVRTPNYTTENLRGIYAGNDQTVKLYYAPKTEPAPAAPKAEPPPAKPEASAPAAPGQARISFSPASVQVAAGSPVNVTIQVENGADVFSGAPIRIKYDPSKLRLNDMSAGDLLARGGVTVSAVKDIRNDAGEATMTVARAPGSPGVSGSGAIVTLNFVAVGKGSSAVTLDSSTLKNSQGQPVNVLLGSLPVTVQ